MNETVEIEIYLFVFLESNTHAIVLQCIYVYVSINLLLFSCVYIYIYIAYQLWIDRSIEAEVFAFQAKFNQTFSLSPNVLLSEYLRAVVILLPETLGRIVPPGLLMSNCNPILISAMEDTRKKLRDIFAKIIFRRR